MIHYSEVSIIEKLKEKDKETIRYVYESYSSILLTICIRYFKQREIALDIMHEGFMKALNAIETYKNTGSFEGWLKRIVVNHCIDTLRKQKKIHFQEIQEVDAVEEENDLDKTVDKKDIKESSLNINFVRDADLSSSEIMFEINKLPDKYRLSFIMYVIDELTHSEIAQNLEIDEETSRTRLTRARKMLKKALYEKSISILGK